MIQLTEKQEKMINKLSKYLKTYDIPNGYKIVHNHVVYHSGILGDSYPNHYTVVIQRKDSKWFGIFNLDIDVFNHQTWDRIKEMTNVYIKSVINDIRSKL